MKKLIPQEQESGLSLNDILFILFRHKWKIIASTATGILAAAFFFYQFPIYESTAKLVVRYVLDRSAFDNVESGGNTNYGPTGDSIMNAEVEILTSADLAAQVAESVGPMFLRPEANEPNIEAAAGVVAGGMKVTGRMGTNVLAVSFRSSNKAIPKRVLENLIAQYFDKHMQVHRSLGTFDTVMRQTESVRSALHDTEEQLKNLKIKAGIISLPDSTANVNSGLIRNESELNAAEVERAEQSARVKEIERWLSGMGGAQTLNPSQQNKNGVQEYQSLGARLDDMRRKERDLLSKYTDDSQQVKITRVQIAALENRRHELEKQYPGILRITAGSTPQSASSRFDIVMERTRLASIEAKAEVLNNQLRSNQEKAERIAEQGTAIAHLQRKLELQESNYKYFETSLEKARLDETLDPSRIPNISIVQNPTDATRDMTSTNKIVAGIVGGGFGFGILLAFLIELVFDRTVKRPLVIESRLHLPLLVSIPYVAPSRNLRLPPESEDSDPETTLQKISNAELGHSIHTYFEAIRDRLILHFALNRMMGKPKLIAVTGVSRSAGISTVAGGLAAALSETGEGKVLLVNMNMGHAEIHPFFHGKPAKSLTEMIESSDHHTSVANRLYLATAASSDKGATSFIPKNFYDLIPDIKASDFDYIIFDMPPLHQTSTTVAFAGFMDKVLMVIESGASRPDSLRRAYSELVSVKANVSCVFNKARAYAPKFVGGEL